MQTLGKYRWPALLAAAVLLQVSGCADNEGAPNGTVTMKPVKWSGFQETLAGLKGKVVLVDFWGEF